MINLLKSKGRERNVSNVSNSSYVGILVIYLVSAAVAATVILPEEEYWYLGTVKSLVWPIYSLARFLS